MQQIIICDAYQTFESLIGETVIICDCWIHSRRRWVEALMLIVDIYREENKLKRMGASEHLRWRQTVVREKVDAYFVCGKMILPYWLKSPDANTSNL